jgi:hypothetical protein
MNVAKVTLKLKEQIQLFSGKLSLGLPLVAWRFVSEALYGMQSRQSLRLSEWGRALHESIPLRKTINRLSRQLDRAGLWQEVISRLLAMARSKIDSESLLVLDLSDLVKPYARKMEYLTRVYDGSKKVLADGYTLVQVIAARRQSAQVIPLYSRLYSTQAPDFEGENREIMKAVDQVRREIGKQGTWVIDRGADRRHLFDYFLSRRLQFIIRLKGDRHLVYRGRTVLAHKLAASCPLPYQRTIVKEDGDSEKSYQLSFGFCPVQLPDLKLTLSLVVVRGFGEKPLMLLTNVKLRQQEGLLYRVLQSYLARWRIEETLRYLKQSYRLEDVRVLTYRRLQNMMALVLAAAYFTMAYLGQRLKLKAMSRLLLKTSRRIFGIPDFRYYALADGIKELLTRHRKGPLPTQLPKTLEQQLPLFDP